MPTTTRSSPSEVGCYRVKGTPTLHGVAAPFGAWADVGSARERIAPGAFAAALRSRGDILALMDHQPTRVLGRRANRSLRLRETDAGLEFDLSLPDTSLGRDVHAMATEGLLGGVSIGFDMSSSQATYSGRKRTLTEVDLREISVVSAFPAYPQTSVQARTLDRWRRWLSSVS